MKTPSSTTAPILLGALAAFLCFSQQTEAAVSFAVIDDPDPGATQTDFATHLGVGISNTSSLNNSRKS